MSVKAARVSVFGWDALTTTIREVSSVPWLRARTRAESIQPTRGVNESVGAPRSWLGLPSPAATGLVGLLAAAGTRAVEPDGDRSIATMGALGAEPDHFSGTEPVVSPGLATDRVSSEAGWAMVMTSPSRAIACPSATRPSAVQAPVPSSFHSPRPPSTQSARTSSAGASAPAAMLGDVRMPVEGSAGLQDPEGLAEAVAEVEADADGGDPLELAPQAPAASDATARESRSFCTSSRRRWPNCAPRPPYVFTGPLLRPSLWPRIRALQRPPTLGGRWRRLPTWRRTPGVRSCVTRRSRRRAGCRPGRRGRA